MTEWRVMTLGELADRPDCEIKTGPFGAQLHMSDYADHGIPVVMPKDMINGRLNFRTVARISEQKASELAAHITQPGDVLLARRGDIGRSILIREQEAGVVCGTGSLRVSIQESELLPEFLFHYLSTDLGRHQLASKAVGVTMPNISASIVRSMEIRFPSSAAQRLIVGILTAYDDLIENNARRIEILEETAQAIYREWFVEFRYPGHEDVPLVDSELGPIPEGWSVKALVDIAQLTMGQSPKSEHYNSDGVGLPFHQGVTGFQDHFPIDKIYSSKGDRLAEAGDILFSVRAPVGRINTAIHPLILGRGLCSIRPSQEHRSFTLTQLKSRFIEIESMGSGAIFNAVKRSDVEQIRLLWPTNERIATFSEIADPIFDQILALTRSNRILQQTRDLLLPRLISGEIDVSGLDIELADSSV